MSQLLIIDVQNTYKNHFDRDLPNSIIKESANFSEVIYLWDNISSQEFHEELPEEFMEDEEFFSCLDSFSKQYAFLRGFMDQGVTDEDIIALGKFMKKNNITDGRDIAEDGYQEEFEKEFKNSTLFHLDFNDYTFYLPSDLMEDLESRIKGGVVLVGGGVNECLKEVSLLLHILDIPHTINFELTY